MGDASPSIESQLGCNNQGGEIVNAIAATAAKPRVVENPNNNPFIRAAFTEAPCASDMKQIMDTEKKELYGSKPQSLAEHFGRTFQRGEDPRQRDSIEADEEMDFWKMSKHGPKKSKFSSDRPKKDADSSARSHDTTHATQTPDVGRPPTQYEVDGVVLTAHFLYGKLTRTVLSEIQEIVPNASHEQLEKAKAGLSGFKKNHIVYIKRAVDLAINTLECGGLAAWMNSTSTGRQNFWRALIRQAPLFIAERCWRDYYSHIDFHGIFLNQRSSESMSVFRELIEDMIVDRCETYCVIFLFGDNGKEDSVMTTFLKFVVDMGGRYKGSELLRRHGVQTRLFMADVPMWASPPPKTRYSVPTLRRENLSLEVRRGDEDDDSE